MSVDVGLYPRVTSLSGESMEMLDFSIEDRVLAINDLEYIMTIIITVVWGLKFLNFSVLSPLWQASGGPDRLQAVEFQACIFLPEGVTKKSS